MAFEFIDQEKLKSLLLRKNGGKISDFRDTSSCRLLVHLCDVKDPRASRSEKLPRLNFGDF